MYSHVEFEDDENDVFYNELRKQVLLLISEDEETHEHKHPVKISKERKSADYSVFMQQGCFFNWEGDEKEPVPMWLSKLWKPGHGTGVFIPSVSNFKPIYKPSKSIKKNQDQSLGRADHKELGARSLKT